MRASVIIPTKNPGRIFGEVLDAVLTQEAPWPFETIVIDSGSTDGTRDLCRSRDVRLLTVEPQEFGHGRTRNQAIAEAEGEFIALITHDALPATRSWLVNLVGAIDASPCIAVAFGRHLPYPDADPYTKRDLNFHFDNFRNMPTVCRMDDPERYQREVAHRQFLHFFSNNNACLRRSVWELYPFPDVEFAEDQIWAKTIIEAGYAKAYADEAAVYHSHSYSLREVARRSFDESAALHRLFGYELCPTVHQLLEQTFRCARRDILWSLSQTRPRRARLLDGPIAVHQLRSTDRVSISVREMDNCPNGWLIASHATGLSRTDAWRRDGPDVGSKASFGQTGL